ncbi:unnamed protein product [Paramecium sonneborni]|uniref:Uncharacterized protein n=1 Tax=Paramecium sonneborni TaxID=65129 RepID=A0A8S1Q1V4_9CILI|nr:unnamed protein product [Paramecium sonneborni]
MISQKVDKYCYQKWQYSYFILNDHILHYCEHYVGQFKGQIHLKMSTIIQITEDPLKIIINQKQMKYN